MKYPKMNSQVKENESMKKLNNLNIRIRNIIIGIIALPALFYFILIGGSISKDSTTWGAFGDYLTLFVSIANLYVFYKLTIKLNEYDIKRNEDADELTRVLERPILAFETIESHSISYSWLVFNAGKGAAMNIRIGLSEWDITNGGKFDKPNEFKKYFSLSGQSSPKTIDNASGNHQIIFAFYEDIEGEEYISVVENYNVHTRVRKKYMDIIFSTDRYLDFHLIKGKVEHVIDKKYVDDLYNMSLKNP
jgi:hypothetical protein